MKRGSYNMKSPSVKRIMKELNDMTRNPSSQYTATPLEDNIFEWHFTVRGTEGTDFEGGIYHGRIMLPTEYPFKPPNIMLLTPTGRFEVGVKICLSISAHHPEFWQPSWSIRTVLLALISFMPSKGEGALGALDWTTEERRILAKKSLNWECKQCGSYNSKALIDPKDDPLIDSGITSSGDTSTIVFKVSKKKEGGVSNSSSNTIEKEKEEIVDEGKTITDSVVNSLNDESQRDETYINDRQGTDILNESEGSITQQQEQQPHHHHHHHHHHHAGVQTDVRRNTSSLDAVIMAIILLIVALIFRRYIDV